MKATIVQFETQGPPDVMKFKDIELAPPGPGEVTIEQTVIGLNFIDIYHLKNKFLNSCFYFLLRWLKHKHRINNISSHIYHHI